MLGALYWIGFQFVVPNIGDNRCRNLVVERKLYFHEEHGYPVQWHEKINFDRVTGGKSRAVEEITTEMRSENGA